MSDPLDWLLPEADARRRAGLERRLVPYLHDGRLVVDPSGRRLLNLGTNDYLGLRDHPRIRGSSASPGAGASALVSGWSEAHERLCIDLAAFEHTEAAVLFPSGYAANVGTITALAGSGDAVYVDRLDHASLIDGARLSGASLRVYPHCAADRLDTTLSRERGRYRRVLIATDGVFSMDGDLAPLEDLIAIARRHEAMLLVDEAHGTGVHGATGRGACEALNAEDGVSIRVGTLSKSLGTIGGFVAGPRLLIDHLVNHARSLIYSTALPPVVVQAATMALAILRAEPERRTYLRELADRLRAGLAALDIESVAGSRGPIVPILVGAPEEAVRLSSRLAGAGFYVPPIRPPTVPRGTSRLRVSLSADMTAEEIDRLLKEIADTDLPRASADR